MAESPRERSEIKAVTLNGPSGCSVDAKGVEQNETSNVPFPKKNNSKNISDNQQGIALNKKTTKQPMNYTRSQQGSELSKKKRNRSLNVAKPQSRHVEMYPYPGSSTSKMPYNIEQQFQTRPCAPPLKSSNFVEKPPQIEPKPRGTNRSSIRGETSENNMGRTSRVSKTKENTDAVIQPTALGQVTSEPLPGQTVSKSQQLQAQKAVTILAFSLLFIVTQLPPIWYCKI